MSGHVIGDLLHELFRFKRTTCKYFITIYLCIVGTKDALLQFYREVTVAIQEASNGNETENGI